MDFMSTIYLLLLGVCVFQTCQVTAKDPADMSHITWTNSLATDEELANFLKSSHGMASEVLSLKTATKRKVLVMGTNSSGPLTLEHCLTQMKTDRNIKQLFLEVTDKEIYTEAKKVLNSAQHTWAKSSVTLHMRVFKGPNGQEPTITPEDITDITDNTRKCFGMTVGYRGKDSGYTDAILDKMKKDWAEYNFDKIPNLVFSVDIYHLSKTPSKVQEKLQAILHNVKRHVFTVSQEMQDKVDRKNFMAYLDSIDKKSAYFNWPERFGKVVFRDDDSKVNPLETTVRPIEKLTEKPAEKPVEKLTPKPTAKPTEKPTAKPTPRPTPRPTPKPTTKRTPKPTEKTTHKATEKPTHKHTKHTRRHVKGDDDPTGAPTGNPTDSPSEEPTGNPNPDGSVETDPPFPTEPATGDTDGPDVPDDEPTDGPPPPPHPVPTKPSAGSVLRERTAVICAIVAFGFRVL